MSLIQICFSILLSSFTWTAARVVPSCSTLATLVMTPPAAGLARLVSVIKATTMATAAAAIRIGTIGGKVHLARSNSSDIGTWPASAGGVGLGCGVGFGVSG